MSMPIQRVTSWIFLLFLAVFAAWGVRNPNLRIDSDPSAYLRFAEALSRGHYYIDSPADAVFEGYYPPGAIHRGTYTTILLGPHRGVVFYAIGFPLFLAPFIRLGGIAGAYLANLAVFLALFALLRAATRRLFAGHPAADAAGLLAPALYLLANRGEIFYFLAPYRDPLAHLLLLAAVHALLLHLQEGRRARHAALAGLFLGLATAVRETAVLAALPLGLFWGWHALRERRLPPPATLAACALAALLGVSPLLAQNAVNTGNPFYPTQVLDAQMRMGNIKAQGDPQQFRMRGLNLRHFPGTEPKLVERLLHGYDPVFVALLAAGLVAGARHAAVPLLLVPFVAVFTLFFGLWVKPMMRYLFVTQVAVAPILAIGVAGAAERAGRLLRRPWLPAAAGGAALLAAAGILAASTMPVRMRFAEAAAFRRDFEAAVPKGALVLAERPMRDVVEHLTHAAALYPDDFTRPERGLTFAAAMARYRAAYRGIYFLDNPDGDLRDGMSDTPVTRERILQHDDLEPVARFPAARYGAERLFGAPEIGLWRAAAWSRREVAARVALPAGGPALVRLNGRGLPAPVAAEIRVGGALVGRELRPGLNWFLVDGGGAGPREAELRVAAAAPIPADLDPAAFAAAEPVHLDTGNEAVPLDETFLSPELLRISPIANHRGLAAAATATVPAAEVPGTALVLALRTRMPDERGAARVRLGDAVRTVRGAPWQTVRAALAPAPPAAGEARAEAAVRLENLGPAGGGTPPPVPVERLVVQRVPVAPLPLALDFRGGAGEALLAEGFHEADPGTPGAPRATSGEAVVLLPLPPSGAGRRLRLTLRFTGTPPAAGEGRLRVSANGAPLGDFPVAPGADQEAAVEVPAGLLRPGINELALAGPAWRPAEHGGDDGRPFGVAVSGLRLEEAR